MTEEQRYVPGTILQDQATMSYWLVLRRSAELGLNGHIANVISGEVRHLCWLDEPKPISHLEVMW